VEIDPALVELGTGREGGAPLGQRSVEVLDGGEVLVGERLVERRPEAFSRLELGAVGWQVDEKALGDGQASFRVPACVVEDEDEDPLPAGAGLMGEESEQLLEERLGDAVAMCQKTSPELGWAKAVTWSHAKR